MRGRNRESSLYAQFSQPASRALWRKALQKGQCARHRLRPDIAAHLVEVVENIVCGVTGICYHVLPNISLPFSVNTKMVLEKF